MGRPRTFDEDKVLGSIMDLFWKYGYHGTSLSMIEKATNLKKQSLYAAFGDKNAMYAAALTNYERVVVDSACTALRGSKDPLERLNDFLSAPIKSAFEKGDMRGCFLCNATTDQAALDPAIKSMVKRGFNKLESALSETTEQTSMTINPQESQQQARLFLAVYSGLRVMAKGGVDRSHLESIRDLALLALKTAS